MEKTKEPIERIEYRERCKHQMYGNCTKHSGYIGKGVHVLIGCTGECRRMKLWDSKHGYKDVEFDIQYL